MARQISGLQLATHEGARGGGALPPERRREDAFRRIPLHLLLIQDCLDMTGLDRPAQRSQPLVHRCADRIQGHAAFRHGPPDGCLSRTQVHHLDAQPVDVAHQFGKQFGIQRVV